MKKNCLITTHNYHSKRNNRYKKGILKYEHVFQVENQSLYLLNKINISNKYIDTSLKFK